MIGDKQESGQDTTTIKKPFVLLPMQPAPGKPVSVGFTPYSPYANSDTITIKTANIISEVEPKTELANAYKKNTGTGIMEPTIKEKQFITENPLPDLKW